MEIGANTVIVFFSLALLRAGILSGTELLNIVETGGWWCTNRLSFD